MSLYRCLLTVCALLMGSGISLAAQQTTTLSLQSPTATLQTGTEYQITIRLDDAPGVWVLNLEISYDPRFIYIIGTKAGSPVHQGEMFAPIESTTLIRNVVQNNRILYTISMLAPADPIEGSGIAATFRIYPLSAGTTQLAFSRATITGIAYAADGSPQSKPITFTPILLELNISGETVEAPDEATATPEPTETSTPFTPVVPERTVQPTLVNVTAAPATPAPLATLPTPTAGADSGSSLPLILAIIVMLVGGIGAVIVIVTMRRRKR